MKTYQQFVEDALQEKLIVINDGKDYGQIIFLIGGSASGKGFALDNFLDKKKFKVRDVDAWKEAFIKLEKQFDDIKKLPSCEIGSDGKPIRTGECNPYGALHGLNLRNPSDVAAVHEFVNKLQVKEKTLELMLSAAANPDHLPNIVFDITGKKRDFVNYSNDLLKVGYLPENIHLIWVLTNYYDAVKRNATRPRIVPDDILLASHENVSVLMDSILNGEEAENLNGNYYVILNNPGSTEYWEGTKTIKNFKYMKIKDAGEPMLLSKNRINQLYAWIRPNIPKTDKTSHIFDREL